MGRMINNQLICPGGMEFNVDETCGNFFLSYLRRWPHPSYREGDIRDFAAIKDNSQA